MSVYIPVYKIITKNDHLKDPQYEKQINALIPAAELEAKKRVRELGKFFEMRESRVPSALGKQVRDRLFKWSFEAEFFHAAMNRMAAEQGLRRI